MKILQTTDYKLFKFANGNRQVVEKHVDKLTKAIAIKNLLHLNPVIVDGSMIVIDGQHRLEAAKRLKLPVFYIVDKNISDTDIANLNSNKSNWKPEDYLNYFASKGNESYLQLQKFLEKWPGISISTALYFLSYDKYGEESGGVKLKNGAFVIADTARAESFLNEVDKLFPDFQQRHERAFLQALEQCMAAPEYNSDTMAKKVKQASSLLRRQANRDQYVDMLEKIYNYHNAAQFANFRITVEQRKRMLAKEAKKIKDKEEKKPTLQKTKNEKKFAENFLKQQTIPKEGSGKTIPVKIDANTIVYVKPGTDIESYKKKYAQQQEQKLKDLKINKYKYQN